MYFDIMEEIFLRFRLQYICNMHWFNYNGKIYTNETAIIGAGNRGLRYGDGLFETMKMKDGNLVLEDEHFARLWKGMQVLQFTVPKHFNPDKLKVKTGAKSTAGLIMYAVKHNILNEEI